MATTYIVTGRDTGIPQLPNNSVIAGLKVGETFTTTLSGPVEAELIAAGLISKYPAPKTVQVDPTDTAGQVPVADGSGGYTWGAGAEGAEVSSFQGRTGDVTLTKADVTGTGLAASDVSADAIGAAATAQANAIAASAQGLTPTAVKTSAYNAIAADFIPVDISGGAVPVTLPTAPADKTRIGVKVVKVSGTPGSTSCSVAAGGSDVFNVAAGSTTLTLTALFQGVLLQYKASGGIWYVSTADSPVGVALGAAKLGTDGTVGGPSGSALTSSVVLGSSFGLFSPWDNTHYTLGLGTVFGSVSQGVGQNGTALIAIGGGVTDGTQPTTGSLGAITTGYDNVAIGTPAMPDATTAFHCVAIGPDSQSYNTTGNYNTSVGAQSLRGVSTASPLTGSQNTAIGQGTLANLTSGSGNTAVGDQAANNIAATTNGVFVGEQAGTALTGGSSTVIIGGLAVNQSTASLSSVTVVGASAVQAAGLTAAAANIVAIGDGSLKHLTTGNQATAVGSGAAGAQTTANSVTAIGYAAAAALTTANAVTAVGSTSAGAIVTGSKTTCVGNGAGNTSSTDHSNMTLLGWGTIGTGDGAVAIGIDNANTPASAGLNQFALGTALHQVKISNNTTGAGSAALGANCPAVTATAPYTWFKMLSSDGSTVYVPAWK